MDLFRLQQFFSANPRFITPAGCGVVTAGDANIFEGIQILLLSINGCSPVTVFDLGLTEPQIAWCQSIAAVTVLPAPDLVVPKSVLAWQTWNKPHYLSASPFEVSIWIDADAFVVGDLEPAFRRAAEGFWVVKHQLRYPKGNDPLLYERHPVRRPFPPKFHLNAGVVGVRRGHPILNDWATTVEDFASTEEIRNWIAFQDEGALHWAIEASGDHSHVIDRPQWNRMFWNFGQWYPTQELFMETFKPADNVIIHATGPKLWDTWAGRGNVTQSPKPVLVVASGTFRLSHNPGRGGRN